MPSIPASEATLARLALDPDTTIELDERERELLTAIVDRIVAEHGATLRALGDE